MKMLHTYSITYLIIGFYFDLILLLTEFKYQQIFTSRLTSCLGPKKQNSTADSLSKSAKIWSSKWIFYVKNHPNISELFFQSRIIFLNYIFCKKKSFLITSILEMLCFLKACPIFEELSLNIWIHKIQWVPLSQLVLGQKSCFLGPRQLSQDFLLHQLWIINYYVKCLSKNLSNENKHWCFQRNDILKILHFGILIHVLSWNIYFRYISDYWEETTNWKSTIIWRTFTTKVFHGRRQGDPIDLFLAELMLYRHIFPSVKWQKVGCFWKNSNQPFFWKNSIYSAAWQLLG